MSLAGCIIVTNGPNEGQELLLSEGERATVGRRADNRLAIADGYMSRQHFELNCDRTTLFVTDLGSSHGTLLNGKKLEGKAALKNGDVIKAGSTEFYVKLSQADVMVATNDSIPIVGAGNADAPDPIQSAMEWDELWRPSSLEEKDAPEPEPVELNDVAAKEADPTADLPKKAIDMPADFPEPSAPKAENTPHRAAEPAPIELAPDALSWDVESPASEAHAPPTDEPKPPSPEAAPDWWPDD